MRRIIRRALRLGTAFVLLLAGLVLSIPGVPGPGFVLVLGAFAILLGESRWLRRRYVVYKRRHPGLFHPIEAWRRRRAAGPDRTRRGRGGHRRSRARGSRAWPVPPPPRRPRAGQRRRPRLTAMPSAHKIALSDGTRRL
ncbi:MAG: hypothetical protein KatS3mg102_2444 [Planctomycetota bacterium]|nr:MAG: hypothetical protein KatS3mg102_2444 [Planctomycetota bacterium]